MVYMFPQTVHTTSMSLNCELSTQNFVSSLAQFLLPEESPQTPLKDLEASILGNRHTRCSNQILRFQSADL